MNLRSPLIIGRSVEGRPIELWAEPEARRGTLIIGGFHGDEPATIDLVRTFPDRPGLAKLPLLNPDGATRYRRYNARGVDLNRNFGEAWNEESIEPSGSGPWSEPETRALKDLIESWRPSKIISLHWALGEIDADGPQSMGLAEAMWDALSGEERAPYRLRVSELGRGLRALQSTYTECPGSLGQWAGYGVQYPDGTQPAMITLELPFDPDLPREEPLPADHWQTVQRRWKEDAAGYLAAVRPAVDKMLDAACRYR